VIDNGTGYTKMGYAGNVDPSYIVPSVIATRDKKNNNNKLLINDLDFYIGDEAEAAPKN
jgi:actin-related protein 3